MVPRLPRHKAWVLAGALALTASVPSLADTPRHAAPGAAAAGGGSSAAADSSEAPGRADYFISTDTIVIGCTAGAAAGILVGSVPVAGALVTGFGVPEAVVLLANLAGMGCGVGAVSGAVAVLTAWMLHPSGG
jgi:hypothetical protein